MTERRKALGRGGGGGGGSGARNRRAATVSVVFLLATCRLIYNLAVAFAIEHDSHLPLSINWSTLSRC